MEQPKIKVLQIGLTNWVDQLSLQQSEEIEWHFLNLGEDTTGFREGYSKLMKGKAFDLVLCTECIDNEVLKDFSLLIESYRLIIDRSLRDMVLEETKNIKIPFFINLENKNHIIEIIRQNFFPNQTQMGTKFKTREISVDENFNGEKNIFGENYIELRGSFSKFNNKNLLRWQYNISMMKKSKKIWLEFEHSDKVSISLSILFLEQFSGEPLELREYSEDEIKAGIEIEFKEGVSELSLALRATGEGSLNIGPLHYRDTRHDFGEYIPGGAKIFDEKNQEIFYYFNPGDLTPPLTVYFAGYRTAEGFEGFGMMKRMGKPFLLFTDPRLEGGAFYIGSENLESKVLEIIKKYLEKLEFTAQQLVLSGLSMGSFGALYYGSQIQPHTVIVGKPIVNLGDVAFHSKLIRPGQFETSLDILYLVMKDISKESMMALNQKFWHKFDLAEFLKTKFKITYMENDDYDSKAYEELLESLIIKGNSIIGKGIPGRHNDNSFAIKEWFLYQYEELLNEDFSPKGSKDILSLERGEEGDGI